MKRAFPAGHGLLAVLLLAGVAGCFPRRSLGQGLPTASELTQRMIQRAQAVAGAELGSRYTCQKRALNEHLDGSGRASRTEEKIYQVTWIAGFPFNRLVKIQGRDLSAEDLKKEELREEKFRQRFVSADPKKMAARKEGWVTAQLLDRYQFTVKERVTLNGRPALVLTFRPKDGRLPDKSIHDKLLNRMAGTLWVDEEDADTVRLSAGLTGAFSLGWFGVFGSLSRCDLFLERRRMPDGSWLNARQILLIHCRKVAATIRFRNTEEFSGFTKAQATNVPSPPL
jgi:hypothetical protein